MSSINCPICNKSLRVAPVNDSILHEYEYKVLCPHCTSNFVVEMDIEIKFHPRAETSHANTPSLVAATSL